MTEQIKPIEIKIYESKVLIAWEIPENVGKIIFPKSNLACRRCHFSDWQILEIDNDIEDDDKGKQIETTTRLELVNYCHDRYKETYGKGLPNIPDCDGLYKQPKE